MTIYFRIILVLAVILFLFLAGMPDGVPSTPTTVA